jgi:hypothetical protein
MLEERIVHFPEQPLRPRGLCRFRGVFRMRVDFAKREVSEHKSQLRPESPLQFLHNRVRASAVRTLVIAVFDERHCCGFRSLRMIALSNGRVKYGCVIVDSHGSPPV